MHMAQHFLLSAEARTLSLKEIYKGGEEKAYQTFKSIRWASTGGDAVCPRCGCCDTYEITTRRKFTTVWPCSNTDLSRNLNPQFSPI
jgi:Transposase zinc-ribbon domain